MDMCKPLKDAASRGADAGTVEFLFEDISIPLKSVMSPTEVVSEQSFVVR